MEEWRWAPTGLPALESDHGFPEWAWIRGDGKGPIPKEHGAILDRLDLDTTHWDESVERYGGLFYRVSGKYKRIPNYKSRFMRFEKSRDGGLFDWIDIERKISSREKALSRLEASIDWEPLVVLLRQRLDFKSGARGGRPPKNLLLMLRMCVLAKSSCSLPAMLSWRRPWACLSARVADCGGVATADKRMRAAAAATGFRVVRPK